jgi:hypothetical protein
MTDLDTIWTHSDWTRVRFRGEADMDQQVNPAGSAEDGPLGDIAGINRKASSVLHRPSPAPIPVSPCSRDLRGIAQREVIIFRNHFEVALVEPNHCRAMADGHDRRIRQPSCQSGIELRLQLLVDS